MKKAIAILAALGAVVFVLNVAAPTQADDGSDYVVTCGPNPFPDPQAEDDCMPTTPGLVWQDGHIVWGATQPNSGTCDIEPDDPHLHTGYHTVTAFTDVTCDEGTYMLQGSLSVKVFWTTCRRGYDNPPTTCDLNTSAYPHNPAYDPPNGGKCGSCSYLAALAEMNGRRYYTRYYWAHTIARSKNIYPYVVSYWTPPKAIYVP